MNCLVNRYSLALRESLSFKELSSFLEYEEVIRESFLNGDFYTFITSPLIDEEQKVNFLAELYDGLDLKIVFFLRILVRNNRLKFLPSVMKDLSFYFASERKSCRATVYYFKSLDDRDKGDLEQIILQKFGMKVEIIEIKTQEGILRVCIENLGIEFTLSRKRVMQGIRENILNSF